MCYIQTALSPMLIDLDALLVHSTRASSATPRPAVTPQHGDIGELQLQADLDLLLVRIHMLLHIAFSRVAIGERGFA